ncbi:MAG: hypothetical protein EOO80_19930 [Oxalobacteraceae bacterium]|nr:MAG: hypothetical protein EOO80_19930 [Oxalobacteraceae bacterium]
MRACWLMLLWVVAMPAMAGVPDLVGKTMPPYPQGLRDVGGTCLSDVPGTEHVCDYSIGMLADAGGDPEAEAVIRYVIAGKLAGRDGPLALWKITDAKPYPRSRSGYFWQAGSCRVDKRSDANVVAVVRQASDQEYLADVIWAQRLDLASGKFTALDTSHVDCVNEGYGEGP